MPMKKVGMEWMAPHFTGKTVRPRATPPALLDALLPGKGVRRGRCVPERTVLAANVVKQASTFLGRL
jgi:hypothetical protein